MCLRASLQVRYRSRDLRPLAAQLHGLRSLHVPKPHDTQAKWDRALASGGRHAHEQPRAFNR